MNPTLRADEAEAEVSGPQEQIVRRLKDEERALRTASRSRMIQRVSLDLLGDIEACLRTDKPDEAAQKVSVQGNGVLAMQILQAARAQETMKPGGEPSNPRIIAVLDIVERRTEEGYISRANQPADLVPMLAGRIARGEDTHPWEMDLTDEQLNGIRALLPEALRPITDRIRRNKNSLQDLFQLKSENKQLELELVRHCKFPEALNLRGFRTKFDSLPPDKKNGVFLFFDLADFKQFNSTYKNNFVDKMILDRLCRMLRFKLPNDVLLGIHGGDEFLLYDPDAEEGQEMASTVSTIIRDAMRDIDDDQIQDAAVLLGETSLPLESVLRIKDDLSRLHAKMVVTRSRPDLDCATLESKTAIGLKSAESHEMKSRYRFPTVEVTGDNGDLQMGAVFSAIGEERTVVEERPTADFTGTTFLVDPNGVLEVR